MRPLPTDKDLSLINVAPMEALMIDLKVALFAGIIIGFPVIAWQAYLFLAPGLYKKEKAVVWPVVISSTFFFLLGTGFCYEIVLPLSFDFLSSYSNGIAEQTWTQANFVAFVMRLILAFGFMFQLPVVCYFLARLGLLTSDFLKSQFRIAIVFIFITAALLTPPDIISQCLLALPLLILYGISILVVRRVEKKAAAAEVIDA
jgi:sec-independent protein translocase protein TatC